MNLCSLERYADFDFEAIRCAIYLIAIWLWLTFTLINSADTRENISTFWLQGYATTLRHKGGVLERSYCNLSSMNL